MYAVNGRAVRRLSGGSSVLVSPSVNSLQQPTQPVPSISTWLSFDLLHLAFVVGQLLIALPVLFDGALQITKALDGLAKSVWLWRWRFMIEEIHDPRNKPERRFSSAVFPIVGGCSVHSNAHRYVLLK